jgi:putative transcriptional regulator
MKCEECGASVTVDRKAVRRYKLGGLPHVELHGVEVTQCKACGYEEVGIPRMGQLHRVLASIFVHLPRRLLPTEIRFLRKHIGWSGEQFADAMGVTRENASRWENGEHGMAETAERLLRAIALTHEPTESYAVEDLLKALPKAPIPAGEPAVTVANNSKQGWKAEPVAA